MMHFRRRSTRSVIALGLLLLTGCYTYVPVSGGAHPGRGTQVRARLATPESVALSGLTVANVVELNAEVVRSGEDSLVVSAISVRSATSGDFAAAGETVAIPAGSVGSLEERRLSGLRSSALIVAAGAAATLFFRALGTIDGGAGGGKPGPRPN